MAVTIIRKGTQSDPALVQAQLHALQTCLAAWGPEQFMAYFIWILGKETDVRTSSRYVPFQLNTIQQHLITKLVRQNLLLKARQMGGTTFMMIYRLMVPAVTQQGFRGLFVSQKFKYAQEHFKILDRARRTFGMMHPGGGAEMNTVHHSLSKHLLKRRLANKQEILFENLDSSVFVDTAENDEAGQGVTVNGFVGSEFSRWPKNPAETLANIRGSLSVNATQDLECTANGAQGPFYELVNKALKNEGIYKLHFYEWWWTDEYRLDLSKQDEDTKQRRELYLDTKADLERIDRILKIEKETGEKDEGISQRDRDEALIRDHAHLNLLQVCWRRTQIAADSRRFRENYPESARGAFLTDGSNYFDNELVERRSLELENFKPYKVGRNGEAILYWRPRTNVRYLIGADVMEGLEAETSNPELKKDFHTAYVIELETGEQVAQYRSRARNDQYATDLATLGAMYNDAEIAVERNSYGVSVLLYLTRDEDYQNVYAHPRLDKVENTVVEKIGFPTNKITRPIALSYLQKHVEENPDMIWSKDFCDEARSFIVHKGKPQAAPGAHDDSVAAMWIAMGARAYRLGFWTPIRPRNDKGGDFD